MNLQTNSNQKGFTIVELLIVIVVIGILAAITLVAYNGIQNRAKASQYKSDAANIAKIAEAVNAKESGTGYPTSTADFSGGDAKLPSNIAVSVIGSTATFTPSDSNGPAIDTATGKKTYTVRSCGATGTTAGVIVYYWDPAAASGSNSKTVTAGSPTSTTAC